MDVVYFNDQFHVLIDGESWYSDDGLSWTQSDFAISGESRYVDNDIGTLYIYTDDSTNYIYSTTDGDAYTLVSNSETFDQDETCVNESQTSILVDQTGEKVYLGTGLVSMSDITSRLTQQYSWLEFYCCANIDFNHNVRGE